MKGGSVSTEAAPVAETATQPTPVETTPTVEHDGCRRWQVEVEEAETVKASLHLTERLLSPMMVGALPNNSAHVLKQRALNGSSRI